MKKNNNEWAVEFETHSRDAAIKACVILARGLSLQGETSILITGCVRSGKSMIVDAIIRDLSDANTAFKMSNSGMLERSESEAMGRYLSKTFNKNGCKFIGAFYRDGLFSSGNLNIALGKIKSKIANPLRPRIAFKTGRFHEDNFDCVINICEQPILGDMEHVLDSFGTREWKIEILEDKLRIPQMKAALDHLRMYETRRQKRMERCLAA